MKGKAFVLFSRHFSEKVDAPDLLPCSVLATRSDPSRCPPRTSGKAEWFPVNAIHANCRPMRNAESVSVLQPNVYIHSGLLLRIASQNFVRYDTGIGHRNYPCRARWDNGTAAYLRWIGKDRHGRSFTGHHYARLANHPDSGSLPSVEHRVFDVEFLAAFWFSRKFERLHEKPWSLAKAQSPDAGGKRCFALGSTGFERSFTLFRASLERRHTPFIGALHCLSSESSLLLHDAKLSAHELSLHIQDAETNRRQDSCGDSQAHLPSLVPPQRFPSFGLLMVGIGVLGISFGIYIARVGPFLRGIALFVSGFILFCHGASLILDWSLTIGGPKLGLMVSPPLQGMQHLRQSARITGLTHDQVRLDHVPNRPPSAVSSRSATATRHGRASSWRSFARGSGRYSPKSHPGMLPPALSRWREPLRCRW